MYSLIFVNENKTNLKRTQLNPTASNHKPNLNYTMHVQLTLRGHVPSFDLRNSRRKMCDSLISFNAYQFHMLIN